jgi:hypothetical protein
MSYRFLLPARDELEEAIDFYNQRRRGLGYEFAEEVESTISRQGRRHQRRAEDHEDQERHQAAFGLAEFPQTLAGLARRVAQGQTGGEGGDEAVAVHHRRRRTPPAPVR